MNLICSKKKFWLQTQFQETLLIKLRSLFDNILAAALPSFEPGIIFWPLVEDGGNIPADEISPPYGFFAKCSILFLSLSSSSIGVAVLSFSPPSAPEGELLGASIESTHNRETSSSSSSSNHRSTPWRKVGKDGGEKIENGRMEEEKMEEEKMEEEKA